MRSVLARESAALQPELKYSIASHFYVVAGYLLRAVKLESSSHSKGEPPPSAAAASTSAAADAQEHAQTSRFEFGHLAAAAEPSSARSPRPPRTPVTDEYPTIAAALWRPLWPPGWHPRGGQVEQLASSVPTSPAPR